MEFDLDRRGVIAGALLSGVALGAFLPGAARAASPGANPPTKAVFARYANELMSRNYSPDKPGAAILVARGDEVLFRSARGLADIDGRVALQPDSVFRIGSVTKQFAAAGLLKLVELGKVKLDDPLTKYVPGFPNGEHITVLQLLNHTSGVKSYTGIDGYMEERIKADQTTAQMIDVFKDLPVDFAPGADWAYNNSGYVLVGAVIEAASGEAWYAWLDRAIFKPLGMRHTGYGADPKFVAMQVHGYTLDGDKVSPAPLLSMTQPHAAGALVSNVDDLLRWNRALHEGRVLGNATYQQMITPTGAAVTRGYGFGIGTGKVRSAAALAHNGGIHGFSSSLTYLPGPDITVAIIENDDSDPTGDAESADTIAKRLAAAAMGEPYPSLVAVPVDAAVLRAAEGVYRFDGNIRRVLRIVDGKLTAQRDAGQRAVLTAIGKDDFLYADGFNRLQLVRDSAGAITGMRHFPNGDGEGTIGARTNEPLPALEPVAVAVPRAALERLVGDYAGGGITLKVVLEGEALKGQIPGQPPVNLRASSPTRFDVVEAPAQLEFSSGDGPAAEVTLRQGGREMVMKRQPG